MSVNVAVPSAPLITCEHREGRRAPSDSSGPPLLRPASWHTHDSGQLIWPLDKPIRQHTSTGVWISPPEGATWVPPLTMHVGRFSTALVRLGLDQRLCAELPACSCVVAMTPRLRATLLAARDAAKAERPLEPFVPALLEEVRDAGLSAVEDPYPHGAEASRLVRHVLRGLEMPQSLAECASLFDADAAELERELQDATGMSFRRWSRQVRLLRGVIALAEDRSVADAGRLAGYESTGHWVTAFKRVVGTTPGRYYSPLRAAARGKGAARSRAPAVGLPRQAREPARSSFPLTVQTCFEQLPHHTRTFEHTWGELFWPLRASSVSTPRGTWVGHARLAIWVPAGSAHSYQVYGTTHEYMIRPDLAARLPREPCAVAVTPALRESLNDLLDPKRRDLGVARFLDEIGEAAVPPLPLLLLQPRETVVMVDGLRTDPARGWSLERWAQHLGVSRSTLARACRRELGCSFGRVRALLQACRAVELLALGESVEAAARRVGYTNVSKFIATFRRLVGVPPGRYFRMGYGAF